MIVITTEEEKMVFEKERLNESEIKRLQELSRLAKGDILTMTTLAGSGHPGGSISSLDIYLVLFSFAGLKNEPKDRIVISHGHTSPGVYSALARLGYLPVDEVIAFFRKGGSPFEGHVVKGIPFIGWSTGNLGQGLSAGCGFALESKIHKRDNHIYVPMGDGEQQKGQIGEARRFARKYRLKNITVIVDYNHLQISGSIYNVMPQNIAENYLSDGWDVLEINGHDYNEIYLALKKAREGNNPTCILARTVMGKGIPFMENKEKYHGSPLNNDEYKEAMSILGIENRLDFYREMRKGRWTWSLNSSDNRNPSFDTGKPRQYTKEDKLDNRTAFGIALKDIADINIPRGRPVCVFDCDLSGSVKTVDFAKSHPDYFFQGGIQEHNTATIAGALSTTDILTFFADFGVFGIDETYNQQRLNDINKSNLKLILTHVGLDVGPDGKTHQCIDYIGLSRSLFNFKTIVPCDPNQTDRAVRYVARTNGNFIVATGRNRWPVITKTDGSPFFGDDYVFEYGKMDIMAEGNSLAIITYGGMLIRALEIRERLIKAGLEATIVNMASVNEVDEAVMKVLLSIPVIITYEDHNVKTGIAPVIAGYLLKEGYRGRFQSFGVKYYGASGETEEAYTIEGLDIDTMNKKIMNLLI
ncbi:MAG TPA: transketolase [Syntrophorhabdaceae bacterium]|nr:transketolase [Syntrophorhabdaceae bacterium]